ncbi:hypothetical protein [Cohaesibacter sp. ES.047]|uniref:hypothetical protein n=1 Tax=Cohaesibacter sp. ES.047 TaxID=1798205 RepID=UPI0012FDC31A|nr:hypothetical protein [Cohaesibacter sp. ES.047]
MAKDAEILSKNTAMPASAQTLRPKMAMSDKIPTDQRMIRFTSRFACFAEISSIASMPWPVDDPAYHIAPGRATEGRTL